ncbi:Asp23/Gls24 family envelope stress response protein [Corynebacterium provencense]|uniref:Alkaline shock protein 23 n=1 Tax=Corynebacterium provencense TaxID=1737425 RepID=A0A2Z3YPJ9_9CORY|nr:Asp23/Gls24 family envelope stress response protein [Corynebacterium provencense]AWT25391.1 Alkaline shock protein 23 [Corynebacterium provencense]
MTSNVPDSTTKTDTGADATGGTSPAVPESTGSDLVTDHGRTSVADVVVSKIAGMAAREVTGVHDLGGSTARALGALRERIPGGRVNVQQGISVEVGERQAAVDISIVAEYGVAIHELAEAIRRNIIISVEEMTGLEVTEVNVTVHDVHLPGDDEEDDPEPVAEKNPRVQ